MVTASAGVLNTSGTKWQEVTVQSAVRPPSGTWGPACRRYLVQRRGPEPRRVLRVCNQNGRRDWADGTGRITCCADRDKRFQGLCSLRRCPSRINCIGFRYGVRIPPSLRTVPNLHKRFAQLLHLHQRGYDSERFGPHFQMFLRPKRPRAT